MLNECNDKSALIGIKKICFLYAMFNLDKQLNFKWLFIPSPSLELRDGSTKAAEMDLRPRKFVKRSLCDVALKDPCMYNKRIDMSKVTIIHFFNLYPSHVQSIIFIIILLSFIYLNFNIHILIMNYFLNWLKLWKENGNIILKNWFHFF